MAEEGIKSWIHLSRLNLLRAPTVSKLALTKHCLSLPTDYLAVHLRC